VGWSQAWPGQNCEKKIYLHTIVKTLTVFWDAAPGRSVPTFQGCLLPPSSGALMMEAASASETSAMSNCTAQHLRRVILNRKIHVLAVTSGLQKLLCLITL
jgi:hypothetical protein